MRSLRHRPSLFVTLIPVVLLGGCAGGRAGQAGRIEVAGDSSVRTVTRDGEFPVHTLRSPIRFDGERMFAPDAAPRVGRDNERLKAEIIDA